jgi:hypothetical protein
MKKAGRRLPFSGYESGLYLYRFFSTAFRGAIGLDIKK